MTVKMKNARLTVACTAAVLALCSSAARADNYSAYANLPQTSATQTFCNPTGSDLGSQGCDANTTILFPYDSRNTNMGVHTIHSKESANFYIYCVNGNIPAAADIVVAANHMEVSDGGAVNNSRKIHLQNNQTSDEKMQLYTVTCSG